MAAPPRPPRQRLDRNDSSYLNSFEHESERLKYSLRREVAEKALLADALASLQRSFDAEVERRQRAFDQRNALQRQLDSLQARARQLREQLRDDTESDSDSDAAALQPIAVSDFSVDDFVDELEAMGQLDVADSGIEDKWRSTHVRCCRRLADRPAPPVLITPAQQRSNAEVVLGARLRDWLELERSIAALAPALSTAAPRTPPGIARDTTAAALTVVAAHEDVQAAVAEAQSSLSVLATVAAVRANADFYACFFQLLEMTTDGGGGGDDDTDQAAFLCPEVSALAAAIERLVPALLDCVEWATVIDGELASKLSAEAVCVLADIAPASITAAGQAASLLAAAFSVDWKASGGIGPAALLRPGRRLLLSRHVRILSKSGNLRTAHALLCSDCLLLCRQSPHAGLVRLFIPLDSAVVWDVPDRSAARHAHQFQVADTETRKVVTLVADDALAKEDWLRLLSVALLSSASADL